MSEPIRIAFERHIVVLEVSRLLALKNVSGHIKSTMKYKRIAQSIIEIGLIEPLIVARSNDDQDNFLVLDGHLRLAALRDQGADHVRCLISDDDEAFTYNKRVNHLTSVQEHFMIVRAIERGVSEERLAKALNVEAALIRRRRTMLDGICAEVVEALKDRPINPTAFESLKKMKPTRQMEAAELMIATGNFTLMYTKALLAATRQQDLTKPEAPKNVGGLSKDQMARMERELEGLQQDFKTIEASYGDDMLHLVVASGYLTRLVANRAIERYLSQHHAELLQEFRAIIAATSLDQSVAAE